jgi:hypothetical protein
VSIKDPRKDRWFTKKGFVPHPCECGCGRTVRFGPRVRGHYGRKSPVDYLVEDRGYKTPCWIWQLAKRPLGYGVGPRVDGKLTLAHVLYYLKFKGPIAEGMELDHLCRVPSCVNPDHLEPVTHAENIQRGNTATLTPEQVRSIIEEFNLPGKKYGRHSQIARKYGVTPPTIRYIVLGKTWKGVVAI